jgi:hypothetical protein
VFFWDLRANEELYIIDQWPFCCPSLSKAQVRPVQETASKRVKTLNLSAVVGRVTHKQMDKSLKLGKEVHSDVRPIVCSTLPGNICRFSEKDFQMAAMLD